MYRHILVATDGSDLARKGMETGFDLAKLCGAQVTVLTVSEPYPAYDLASKMGLLQDRQAVETYNSESRRLAEKILSDASELASAKSVNCQTLHVDNSAPATAIIETAKFRSCDLIVLTSHGRRGVERFVLGSQAGRVVQYANTSVLVVR